MPRRITHPVPVGHSWCPKCSTVKPLDAFWASKSPLSYRAEHRHTYCIECHREYEKEYRKRRPEYFVAAKEKRSQKWQEEKKPGVYIVDLKIPGKGLFKIGRTVNIKSRIRDLRTSNPDVELVRFVGAPDPEAMERELHDLLSKRRLTREIYILRGEDLKALLTWIDTRDEQAYIALKTPEWDGQSERAGNLKRR
jgi:hypothetical protein